MIPQWLLRFAGMPLQNYPEIFACLGMVVGLYGVLYLEVARVPERGWLLAAVGLLQDPGPDRLAEPGLERAMAHRHADLVRRE
ncbi:MAG TPA: hypothetical protein VKU02_10090 [Gemmataceae bacterium]|nr:hypothetical protein [Gemmataceae bacterium]